MLGRRQQPRCIVRARLPLIALSLCAPIALAAQTPLAAPWDSVGKILKTSGTLTGGFYRYGWPRRDITLKIGDVTVAPALALGAWAGFAADSAGGGGRAGAHLAR